MGIFRFFQTPDNLGVGTGNLALQMPNGIPTDSFYNPAFMVRRSMAPTLGGGRMKFEQFVPEVPLEGNGSYLQGQMALQSLIDLEKGNRA